MEKYYIIIDGSQKGPYLIKELKEIGIIASTLVWTEKLTNWTEAKNVPDLFDIITKGPPPIPQFSDKSAKIEAPITNRAPNHKKQINKALIAKEIKENFLLIQYGIGIGLFLTLTIDFFATNHLSTISDFLFPFIVLSLIAWGGLILVKYIIKGVKWVNENSIGNIETKKKSENPLNQNRKVEIASAKTESLPLSQTPKGLTPPAKKKDREFRPDGAFIISIVIILGLIGLIVYNYNHKLTLQKEQNSIRIADSISLKIADSIRINDSIRIEDSIRIASIVDAPRRIADTSIENREIIFHNKSSQEANLAIAYYKNNTWISTGWIIVKPSSSTIYHIGIYNYDKIYFYAYSVDGLEWSGNDAKFCIDKTNKFEIFNQDCSTRAKFSELKVTGKITELTLGK